MQVTEAWHLRTRSSLYWGHLEWTEPVWDTPQSTGNNCWIQHPTAVRYHLWGVNETRNLSSPLLLVVSCDIFPLLWSYIFKHSCESTRPKSLPQSLDSERLKSEAMRKAKCQTQETQSRDWSYSTMDKAFALWEWRGGGWWDVEDLRGPGLDPWHPIWSLETARHDFSVQSQD